MDSLFGSKPISFSALKDFSKLDQPTIQHLKKVYTCLSLSMLIAAVGSGVHLFTDVLKGGLLSAVASIGLLIALSLTPYDGKNQTKRVGFLMGFAFCTGLGLGPLMDIVMKIDASIIPTAFFYTTLIFFCFTLSALWAKERFYLYLGGWLMSGLSILCFLSLANLFLGARLLFQVELYGGFVLFCFFVAYDTQLIVHKHKQGDKDFVWHSIDLFLDFVQIFRRILIILAQKEDSKKKRN